MKRSLAWLAVVSWGFVVVGLALVAVGLVLLVEWLA